MLRNWKKEFIENTGRVFFESKQEKEAHRKEVGLEKERAKMLKTIGQQTLERDYLQECFHIFGHPVPDLHQDGSQVVGTASVRINRNPLQQRLSKTCCAVQGESGMVGESDGKIGLLTRHCALSGGAQARQNASGGRLSGDRKLVRRLMYEMAIYEVYPKANLFRRNFMESGIDLSHKAKFTIDYWYVVLTRGPL